MNKISVVVMVLLSIHLFSCADKEKKGELTAEDIKAYTEYGDSIVKITFDTLRKSLIRSIGEKGIAGAVAYCNVNAYAITSFYAQKGATIRRTAEKYRNAENRSDSLEKEVWKKYVNAMHDKDSLNSIVIESQGKMHYFKPIIMQAMCKNCHGEAVSEIQTPVLEEIRKRYPNDRATGFKEGDLRGMWHITFPDVK